MLIRCNKESQHPAEWAPRLPVEQPYRTRKTQRDGHNLGVRIVQLCSISSSLSHATLEQPFRTLAIKWEVNIFVKKSSCVFLPASFITACVVIIVSLWCCRWLYNRCTTWTLTKQLEKKLDGNYTRMLRAILNKSWRQHPQNTNYTATCLPSRKLSKLDESGAQDTAGGAGTSS